jgi:hypothetical protein
MKLGISEILEMADKAETEEHRKEILLNHNSRVLQSILKHAYCPSLKFILPSGKYEYQKNQLFDLEHMLYSEARLLYLFVEGGNPALTEDKRKKLFIRLLENVAPADAELLLKVKDKKLPFKKITKKLVKEVFPGLIDEETKEETVIEGK